MYRIVPFALPYRTNSVVVALNRHKREIFLFFLLWLTSCALITSYDPISYKNATDLKAESLLLIEKAQDAPGAHTEAIDSLRLKLRQAYEYEAGKGKPNAITVEQWRLLVDPKGHLLGGFLQKWEVEKKAQGDVFRDEMTKQVAEAFDKIIQLEGSKLK